MTHIRYDIIPQSGGWSIAMGGAIGPPYGRIEDAVADIDAIAHFLSRMGDSIEIVSWRGGEPQVIDRVEPSSRDAHGT